MPASIVVILFSLGALIGVFMAISHFQGREVGDWAGLMHGLFVGTGLITLAILVLSNEAVERGGLLLGGFVLAALGGAFLLSRHLAGKPWPGAAILGHGGFALVMLVLLILWIR